MIKESRNNLRLHRKKRIRSKVFGTAQRPRLCVFRSLKGISAQLIDDENEKTLVAANSHEIKGGKNGIEKAVKTGELLAKKAQKSKIDKAIFDRGGYRYHGKVKALAEGARKGGLDF